MSGGETSAVRRLHSFMSIIFTLCFTIKRLDIDLRMKNNITIGKSFIVQGTIANPFFCGHLGLLSNFPVFSFN